MARSLGVWRCWALVVGSMIGNGVFLLPAVLAPYGSMSLLGWVFAGMGSLLVALMLGNMARRMPRIGGPYAYARAGLGDLPGYFIGWGYWISYVSASAAAAVAFTGYLAFFIPGLAEDPLWSGVVALSVIWVMTSLNITGVRSAGIFQLVTTLLKLLPLFLIAGGGFVLGDVSEVPAINPEDEPLPLLIAGLVMTTMWAYVGMENATIPADDVIDPSRTIPRALIAGVLTATVVYIVATMGVMALIPPEQLAESTAPFADAAVQVVGEWGAALVALGALISIIGALNGNVLATGMIARAIAVDRLFPQRFASVNKSGAPVFALVVSGVLATVLVGMNYSKGLVAAFELLILLSTLTTLLPYAASALSELILQRRERTRGENASNSARLIACGALAFAIFAIVGSGLEVALYGLVLLAAGIPVYFLVRR
jgi:basic amino acid/polyamine antiporter, APA family